MTTRTLLVALGTAAACGAIAIIVLARDGSAPTTAAKDAAPRVSTPHRAEAHPALPTPAAADTPAVARVEEPLIHDDKAYPVDPTPPTREQPLTAEERDPRMKRSIEMLDQAVARTEAKLAAAEAAGDKAAANSARVRIKRLQDVRKQRASELEAAQ